MKEFLYEDMPEWFFDEGAALNDNMLKWVITDVTAMIQTNSAYLNRISACNIGNNISVMQDNPKIVTVEIPMYPMGSHVPTALLEFNVKDNFAADNSMSWDEHFKLYEFGVDELVEEVDLSELENIGYSLNPDDGDGPEALDFEEQRRKEEEAAALEAERQAKIEAGEIGPDDIWPAIEESTSTEETPAIDSSTTSKDVTA